MGNAGSVFGVCEACHAPRSEQDMICGRCGYHFKTKPVPAYPGGQPTTRRTDPPTIVDPPHTVPTAPPPMTTGAPPGSVSLEATMRSPSGPPGSSSSSSARGRAVFEEAPRTMHSPSSPPVADRPVVPVGAWAPPPPPPSAHARTRRSSTAAWILATVGLMVLAAAAGVAVFVLRARHVVSTTYAQPVTFDGPGGVAFGNLDASPAEDFVARYLALTGTQMGIYVGAFSGDDMHELWRAGPFDVRTMATPPAFAVVGTHVLVGDMRPLVHVHDGATGHETHQVELADRATAIWVNGKEAFIEVATGAHVLYDADAGRARLTTTAPSWAPPPALARLNCPLAPASRSACVDPARAGRFAGFSPRYALGVGDLGVSIGRASSGPPLEVLTFSLATGAERWRAPVTTAPGVVPSETEAFEADASIVLATCGDVSAPHVVAFAAKDGARLWETSLSSSLTPVGPRFLVVSPSRVYVPRPGRLDVLDRATGKVLGGVGPVTTGK